MSETTFSDFLTTQSSQIPLLGFVFNLLLAALLAMCLSYMYTNYGQSISNRKQFARQFVLLAMITMLIITIVKSSLALSLGLVGALSIVRYRAAIKEPEELTYLFLAIAIGLGTGADQRIITVVAFIIISSILVVRSILTNKAYVDNNLFLTLIDEDSKLNINEILPILQKYCLQVELKRLDESQNNSELTFLVKLDSNSSFQNISDELRKKASSVKISFIESEV
jgi:hypothetical protein